MLSRNRQKKGSLSRICAAQSSAAGLLSSVTTCQVQALEYGGLPSQTCSPPKDGCVLHLSQKSLDLLRMPSAR